MVQVSHALREAAATMMPSQPTGSATPKEEAEATEFALCLLMPRDLVRQYFKGVKTPLTYDQVEEFARKFQVSLLAAAARLRVLGVSFDIAGPR